MKGEIYIMKTYTKPEINITVMNSVDVIQLSGVNKTLGSDVSFGKINPTQLGLN